MQIKLSARQMGWSSTPIFVGWIVGKTGAWSNSFALEIEHVSQPLIMKKYLCLHFLLVSIFNGFFIFYFIFIFVYEF